MIDNHGTIAYTDDMNLLSVTEAAIRLGISRAAILRAVREGRMSAEKIGQTYVIRAADVKRYKVNEAKQEAGLTRRTG